jgi:hypothetical protein
MGGGAFGWIELVFFYGIAVGIGVWQWVKMDRMLKKTRAEREAKEAAEQDDSGAEHGAAD